MAIFDTNEPFRRIGWNRIQLELPGGWETIVSGDRNLLIEQNFKPLIDLRWEIDHSGRDLAEIFQSIQSLLGNRSGCPVTQMEVPEELEPLESMTQCITFSWSATNGPECSDQRKGVNGVLWRCPDCNTILISQLYKHPKIGLAQLASVLSSIRCHQLEADANASSFWSIQDFQLTLPTSCRMSAHSFQAGLTRLTFQEDDMRLHFCRLAPAVQRLQQGSMSQLLTSLLGEDAEYQGLIESSHLYECVSSPPLTQQVLKRLKRQYPFRWGRIWHNEYANRLLSVIAESSRPIDLDKVHKFCDKYEIIGFQKENAKSDTIQAEQG